MSLKGNIKKARDRMANRYFSYLDRDIRKDAVLLEAGQGKNLNGSIFYILKEIEEDSRWQGLTPYLVISGDLRKKAEDKLSMYGFGRTELVVRDTEDYKVLLSTAAYLFTDNSFPPYFMKRDGQVYVNTWHGTPLKHLGKGDIENSASLGNVQKNYFMADYALFPNIYTRDIFMDDYDLKNFFGNKVLLLDYPRNEILTKKEEGRTLREKLGCGDRQVIAYMPTWRGTGREADAREQTDTIVRFLEQIDERLSDDQVFMVNLHFLVSSRIDYSGFAHIVSFPDGYETYEILNISDMLVTDYSSVFFDYGVSGKKTVIFAYDLEEYQKSRGMYFDIRELPFDIAENVDDLMGYINDDGDFDYSDFRKEFCDYTADGISRRLMDLVVNGVTEGLHIEDNPRVRDDNVIMNMGNIADGAVQEKVRRRLEETDLEKEHLTLVFQNRINAETGTFLRSLPEQVSYVRVMPVLPRGRGDAAALALFDRTGLRRKKVEALFDKEGERLFYGWKFSRMENISGGGTRLGRLMSYMNSRKG